MENFESQDQDGWEIHYHRHTARKVKFLRNGARLYRNGIYESQMGYCVCAFGWQDSLSELDCFVKNRGDSKFNCLVCYFQQPMRENILRVDKMAEFDLLRVKVIDWFFSFIKRHFSVFPPNGVVWDFAHRNRSTRLGCIPVPKSVKSIKNEKKESTNSDMLDIMCFSPRRFSETKFCWFIQVTDAFGRAKLFFTVIFPLFVVNIQTLPFSVVTI